jgi:hypothetical protein
LVLVSNAKYAASINYWQRPEEKSMSDEVKEQTLEGLGTCALSNVPHARCQNVVWKPLAPRGDSGTPQQDRYNPHWPIEHNQAYADYMDDCRPEDGDSDDNYRPSKFHLSNGEVRSTGLLCGGAVQSIARELLKARDVIPTLKTEIQRKDAEIAEAVGIIEQLLTMVNRLLGGTPVRNVPYLRAQSAVWLSRNRPKEPK